MKDSSRLMRVIVGIVLSICAIGICAFIAGMILWKIDWSPKDRTSDWAVFYTEELSEYFWIPSEAKIIEATSHEDMASRDFFVTFALPNTKTPAAWVKEIADKSKLNLNRQTEFMYDSSRPAVLRYDPSTNTYEASVDAE